MCLSEKGKEDFKRSTQKMDKTGLLNAMQNRYDNNHDKVFRAKRKCWQKKLSLLTKGNCKIKAS
jgi:hypothetical protein